MTKESNYEVFTSKLYLAGGLPTNRKDMTCLNQVGFKVS